jgi:hypothetical protein
MRNAYLPGSVRSSAQAQPRKFAGVAWNWASGRMAACSLCRRLRRQTLTRSTVRSTRNQDAYHRANHRPDARRSRHGQDRTMTEVTATIRTLRSSTRPAPRKTNAATQWLAPVGLIALSLIPVLAGAFRLNELMSSSDISAENARFVASPIPVTVHIVSVRVYSLLGALQFVPLLRRGGTTGTASLGASWFPPARSSRSPDSG